MCQQPITAYLRWKAMGALSRVSVARKLEDTKLVDVVCFLFLESSVVSSQTMDAITAVCQLICLASGKFEKNTTS